MINAANEVDFEINPSSNFRLVVWTSPRCVSTAFEKALSRSQGTTGKGVKVLHEPAGEPAYFGAPGERISDRYPGSYTDVPSFEHVINSIRENHDGRDLVVKEMAYYYDGRSISADLAAMGPHVRHAFLIRTPLKSVPSLYKGSFSSETTWDHFEPKDVGFTSLELVYNEAARIAVSLGQNQPTVIDADDLLDDPACTLRAFCTAVGLPYSDEMLTWPKGPLEGWSTWGGWHNDAIESDGFKTKGGGKAKSTCSPGRPTTKAAVLSEMRSTGMGKDADAEARKAVATEMGPYLRLKARALFQNE